MKTSFTWAPNFLNTFKKIGEIKLDNLWEKGWKIFMLPIDSKDFNYSVLKENLLEPLKWYVLSRSEFKEYSSKGKEIALSKHVRQKFREIRSNTWELWEYLLYCFLETELKAPKIISKLELKTAPNNYVNWADWVHLKKIKNGYILLYWESKTIKNLSWCISDSILSVFDFKNWIRRDKKWVELERNPSKFWMWFEIWLIASNIRKEVFSKEDENFIKTLLYPTAVSPQVNTAFAIFIWFEFDLKRYQNLWNSEFSLKIEQEILKKLNEQIDSIKKLIEDNDLQWHNFYFYFLPFSDLVKNRKDILDYILL